MFLGAISSRYETLRADAKVPSKLEASAVLAANDDKADASVTEWISWMDQYPNQANPELQAFQFEGNRSLYFAGEKHTAMGRFQAHAERFPKSKYAVPSASLAW